MRFKSFVRQQIHRKKTEWGRVLAVTFGMLHYYPCGSSALKTVKGRSSEMIHSVVHEYIYFFRQSLLAETVILNNKANCRRKEHLFIFGKATNS